MIKNPINIKLCKHITQINRGVHSGHRVDFELDTLGRFEIEFRVHVVFYIIVNLF